MVLQFLLNMSACYLQLGAYNMVEQALSEAVKNTPKSSILWYRRSQGITQNLGSSLEDIEKAKGYILKAIECKKVEPTFRRGKFLLMSQNLHNADEAFAKELNFVD